MLTTVQVARIAKFLHLMSGSLRLMWRFPLRSALILSSALLGVAGVISAINYASEGRLKIVTQIQQLGTNVLIVTPRQSRSVGGRAKTGTIVTTLLARDYSEILREVPGIVQSSALSTNSFLVKAGDLSKNNCVVAGVEPTYANIRHWRTSDGDFFGAGEARRSARVAVLGALVRRDLFGGESPVGKRIFLNRVPFEVVGVLEERGQGLDATNEDNQVYIPLSTAMRRLANLDYYSGLILEVSNWDGMDDAAREIRGVLQKRHGLLRNLPEDFQIQNQKTLIETEVAASNKLGFLVKWVALSGLFVSGLGILAICWIAVGERIAEIGTRRALGATAFDIFFQFLFEAVIISLLGCALGLLAGWQGTRIIAQRASLPFSFDWQSACLVIAFSAALNWVFALLPSGRAALLDPIRALKFE